MGGLTTARGKRGCVVNKQLSLNLEPTRKLSYEELYAEVWRRSAWKEGHRPGLPGGRDHMTGKLDLSELENKLIVYLQGKGEVTVAQIGDEIGWHRNRVAEVLRLLEGKKKVRQSGGTSKWRKWRAA